MYLLSAFIIILIFWIVFIYNKIIRQKNLVREAWSGMDVQLKRRYSLVPNLVETVKSYMKYESSVLEDITKIRQQCMDASTVKDQSEAEVMLSGGFKKFFALAEAYPELKANENFLNLQRNLIEIEDNIQYSRRYYNGCVRDFNIIVESFPGNIAAFLFKYKSRDYFEIIMSVERECVKADVKEEK